MKIFCLSMIGLLLVGLSSLSAQDTEVLEEAIEQAATPSERLTLTLELGRQLMGEDPERSAALFRSAHTMAIREPDLRLAATAAYQAALAYNRLGDAASEADWLKTSQTFARRAGDLQLLLDSTERLSRLATREGDYRQAYEQLEQTLAYLKEQGSNTGEREVKARFQLYVAEQQIQKLESEKQRLEGEIRALQDQLTSSGEPGIASDSATEASGSVLTEKQTATDSPQAEPGPDTVSEEQRRIREMVKEATGKARVNTDKYDALSKEAVTQQALLQEARAKLAEAKIRSERTQYVLLIAGIATVFLTLLALLLWNSYRANKNDKRRLENKKREIEEEQERSDELLRHILPAAVATEFKENGKVMAGKFPEVSVLRADFPDFSRIADQLSPEELVNELDTCFRGFDFIIGQYPDIEKIKTLGSAYICAFGLTEQHASPHDLIRAALEMQEFLEEHKQERLRTGRPFFEARIGIHTGPVVAGLVGVNKFTYDIWGDTVEIAARVESQGRAGTVNISGATYRLVNGQFVCSYRGKMEADQKGMMDLYFVQGERDVQAAT